VTAPGAGPGRLLAGRYALQGTLGIGGMAEVFLGTDTRLGREVAVKVLRADLARDPSFHERFRREAQAAASLNAPTIVSVYDTGEAVVDGTPGVPWIVMEHVHGRTLRDVLHVEGPLLPERALEIVADVCAALEVAHAAGIVHRDIKPANVMLTPTGEVKVMDFGIARAAAGGSQTMTQTANVIGTAAYLSPEQARGEHVDARSDVYSTGCLLYELLTGRPPFTGDSPIAVAYQHVREDPRRPSEVDRELTAAVDAVVLKAMAKNPGNRYQSATQMRADLLRAAVGQPVEATPVLAEQTWSELGSTRVSRPVQRRRGLVYALFALLLLAIAVGVGLAVKGVLARDTGTVAAPSVVGLSQQAAQVRLAQSGLTVGAVAQAFDPAAVGQVVGQTPVGGIFVRQGGSVDLVVSKGVQMTLVPQVVGQSQREAVALLGQAQLAVGDVIERDGNTTPGVVLETIPVPGSQLPTGQKVTLVVASGKIAVPLVTGLPQEQAARELQQAGFNVGIRLQDSTGPAGLVLSQDPVGTTADRGSAVTLVVSQVPPPPSPSPTPSPTPTADPTPTPTDTPTPTPTGTPPSP
jgi:beta-lactam-binding protein with PASTA domain/tRNA A-37 threonylcarbamoyl transferase component Bud32